MGAVRMVMMAVVGMIVGQGQLRVDRREGAVEDAGLIEKHVRRQSRPAIMRAGRGRRSGPIGRLRTRGSGPDPAAGAAPRAARVAPGG
jgi:hypothetical protein